MANKSSDNKYDDSKEMTPAQIERNETLHKLDKQYLLKTYTAKYITILSKPQIEAICTMIDENNDNLKNLMGLNRHSL